MRWSTIHAVPQTVQHVYLSPHFDDAALSVGGVIAAQVAAGEQVLIVTVCSAAPSGELTPFAAHLHERWGAATEPMTARQAEDERAAAILGADVLWLDKQDAIYRHPGYNSVAAIFAEVLADDPLISELRSLLAKLEEHLPQARWYAPLAIGNHVDHQVTFHVAHDLAARAIDLVWYEDLPYATKPQAVEQRLAQIPDQLVPINAEIGPVLERKLDAVAAYASQMLELFTSEERMRAQLAAYAHQLAGPDQAAVERLWRGETV